MNPNFVPELICLFPLSAAFYLGWKERKEFHSVKIFLLAILLFFLARLSDVIIQLPAPVAASLAGVPGERMLQNLNDFSDITDTVGVFLLVLGFVRTMKYQREEQRRIKDLEALLPMCAWCKNIRMEDGSWKTMESYILQHVNRQVTHGICPACREKLRQETPA